MVQAWPTVLCCALAVCAATTRHCTATPTNDTNGSSSTIVFKMVSERKGSKWSTQVNFEGHSNTDDNWQIRIDRMDGFQCAGSAQFTATNVAPGRTVPGYTYFPGLGYYKMHEPSVNWEGARRTCVREGGHLAIINSEHEADMLQLMFAKTSSQKPFALIGFHDHYIEGEFLTIYDVPLAQTGFNRWSGPQPDNAGGSENCGSIHRFDGSLNDINCESVDWPFICEQEL